MHVVERASESRRNVFRAFTLCISMSVPLWSATLVSALELTYVSHVPLHLREVGLTEPSGLAVAPDGSGFWVVSDNTRRVFRLDIDGQLSTMLDRDELMRDLEGIAVSPDQDSLFMVSERNSSVIEISVGPPYKIRAIQLDQLPTPEDLGDAMEDRGDGLEGIAQVPSTGAILVLKERNPRLLIEIAPTLDRVLSVRALDSLLPEGEDVSGLTVDPFRNGLWLVSDVGKSAHFLPDEGDTILTFDLYWRDDERMRRLDNVEGVALSLDGQALFVVTDDGKDSRLVEYKILGGTLPADQ